MADTADNRGNSTRRRIGSIFVWLLAAGILFAFYESIVLLLIGMIPTGVALIVDRTPQKDQARSVGYLNFAGCLPWLVDFWMSGSGFNRVFEIVGDPLVLAVMYSAAAVGWGLCYALRPAITTYLTLSNDYQEKQIGKRQQELVEQWGEEVRDAVSPETAAKEGTKAD